MKHQDRKFWKDYWEAAEEFLKILLFYPHPSAAAKYVILMSSSGNFCKSHSQPCVLVVKKKKSSFSPAFKFHASSSHQQTLNWNQTETGLIGNVVLSFSSAEILEEGGGTK